MDFNVSNNPEINSEFVRFYNLTKNLSISGRIETLKAHIEDFPHVYSFYLGMDR